jgi:hypothetical protein
VNVKLLICTDDDGYEGLLTEGAVYCITQVLPCHTVEFLADDGTKKICGSFRFYPDPDDK